MKRAWTALAVVLALACALAVTWPAASAPSEAILCNYVHPDCLSNHWLLVWVADRMAEGGSILHNDRYYWPVGDAPWLAGNGSEGFAYLPFHLAFGWPVGSTLYLVGVLFLNGLAGYALARAAGASRPASLAAATTAGTMLYAVHELGAGRFSQVSFCWLGFFLAAWLRFLRKPTLLWALAAAALLAVASLFYWYYGFFGVLAGAVLLVAFAARDTRPPLAGLAAFAVTYLALIAPLLWVYLHYWSSIPGTAEDVFPHPESVGDSTWPGIPFLVAGGRHAGRALPFATCVLAIIAIIGALRPGARDARASERRRVTLALAAVALLFVGLMAGSLLPNGPYTLIYGIGGPLRRFWWPYRHVVVLNLALGTLAALGADAALAVLTARAPRLARFGPALLVALALSVPAQLTVQRAPWQAQFSRIDLGKAFYANLRDAPGTVLVEPPLAPSVASAQTPLIYQIFHDKALLAGHALWVDRVRPEAWDAYVAANTFLVAMQRLDRGELGATFTFEPAHLRALIDSGARTYVVNQEYFPLLAKDLVKSYDALFTALFGPPIATGERIKAWDATAWKGTSTVEIPPFAWPSGLRYGGPTLSLQAPRPPSVLFWIPGPKDAPKAPKKSKGARATPAKAP